MSFLLTSIVLPLALLPLGFLLKERHDFRQRLSEQQSLIESAFTASAGGMVLMDLKGRILRINRALCEMLGYPEDELLGSSLLGHTYPDDHPQSVLQFQRLIRGEIRNYQLQKRYVHRSGHLFWTLASNTLVKDERGRPRYCVANIQEIPEGKLQAEALTNREHQLNKAQELAKLASWEWDLAADVITWSEPVYKVFGLNPEDYEPRLSTYLDFVHPDDRELIKTSLEQIKEDQLPLSLEQRIFCKDGTQRILHVRAEVEVGPQGQAMRMIGTVQDVTEIRQTMDAVFREVEQFREALEILRGRNVEIERQIAERDEELMARDLMFRRIVTHAPVALAYFDSQLRCQWMSPVAQARLGITDENVSQLSAAALPLFGNLSAQLEAALAAGKACHESNVPMRIQQDGREQITYWDYSLVPYLNPHGESEGLLAFGHEVTDRIEKERLKEEQIKTLEASEALKDHFLNSLSHEIRSPLTVILGAALLFQGEALGPLTDKQRLYMAKLLRNGRDLSRLINNVLEANLLRSGRLELHPEPLSLEDLIREVQTEFQESVSLKGQQMLTEIAPELPRVSADRRRLLHVWINLVANAVHFAPEGGEIRLAVRGEADHLFCEVSNTGSRISQDMVADLFTAMDRPGRGQKGLGLGLGLSKALVEAHGGTLGVESRDSGVTAWFTLPYAAEAVELV